MKGNLEVIQALQAALAREAQLNMQYRHDWRIVKFMRVKAVARKLHKLGGEAHSFMKKVADRILFLGGGTNFAVGQIVDQQNLTAIFAGELALEMGIVQPYEQSVQLAMKALDDTTRNLFEHLLKWHEEHVAWLEGQQRLMASMGGEAEYIQEFARK